MANPVEDQGARQLRAVTPTDNANLALGPCRALWVGGAGNLAVITAGDTAAVTLSAVPAGTIVPVRAQVVMSTNTTATLIVALY
jgi:hypothetical protein